MIKFAREFGLEVTLTSYGLPEGLFVRSRGVGAVNSRGVPKRFPFLSFVPSNRGDNVASQSHFSLSTVTGLTGFSGIEIGFWLLPPPVNFSCSSRTVLVDENFYSQDIPLVVLVQQEKLKKMKEHKKTADPCKLSRNGRTNPVLRCGSKERISVFTEEKL